MRGALVVGALVLALVVAAPASADTSLAGWWRLNEGAGVTAQDSSSYADPGAISGGAQWVTGRWGTALSFDGSTGLLQVPDSTSLEPTGAVTVTAWVKASAPGIYKYIVAKGASSCNAASYGLYTGRNGGAVFYVSQNGGLSYVLSPDAGPGVWDGNWHFLAGTYDGSSVRLYLDGNQIGSGTPASGPIGYGLPDANDLFVAHYAGCSGLDFPGAIDEPQVWMRALSPSDVVADMTPYTFAGFYQPVDNPPTVNTTKAGSAIPVKFSLGGDFGLNIFAAASPGSHQVNCTSGAPTDAIEQTVTAGSSSLQYDPTSGQYTYVWKTDKSWTGTCRVFDLTLNDGLPAHTAMFQFK